MLEFRTNAAILAADLQCTTVSIPVVESCGLIALEDISLSSDNVAKVAETITLK
jgi:hypothetical protein